MDLNMSRTPSMPSRRHVVRLVALVAVVLDSHSWPFRALIDSEREHRTHYGEMLARVVEPHLERGAQPESGRFIRREPRRDRNK